MHSIHDPCVPFVHPFFEELRPGARIEIHGHAHHHGHETFAVELLSGPHIVLHLSFRFHHHEHILVLNSSAHGQWGVEQRIHNPIHHGGHFHLGIHVHHNHYDIHVNGVHLTSYAHRYSFGTVQALGIHGGVRVEKIHFEGFPFHHQWGHHSQYDWGHGGYNGYGTSQYVAPAFHEHHRHHGVWRGY